MQVRRWSRRGVLRGGAVTLGAIAVSGCLGGDSGAKATGTPVQPMVAFDFTLEGQRLTITMIGGDSPRADRVFVRGDGFAETTDVDMTGPGPWAGAATGEFEGKPALDPGDAVVVGATPDYEIELVWEYDGAPSGARLSADTGPNA